MKQAGHIRKSGLPNRRSQDGKRGSGSAGIASSYSIHSKRRSQRKYSTPYDIDRSIKVRHGEWMAKFCASVAWRTLFALREDGKFRLLTEQQATLADKALETWSRFLLGGYKHVGAFELHVLTFGEIESASFPEVPQSLHVPFIRQPRATSAKT
jgi:hypothetical protein